MLNACWYPSDTPCPSPRLDIIVWSMLACEISSTAGIDRPYQDPKCYFASQTDIAIAKCQLHMFVLVLLFSETGSNGLRHLFTFFRGGESMWVVVFFATLKPENLRSLRLYVQLYTKKNSGVSSVSTGNRKTPADPFRKRISHIPSYSMKRGTAWLSVCPLVGWKRRRLMRYT